MHFSNYSKHLGSEFCTNYSNQGLFSIESLKLSKNIVDLDLSNNCLINEVQDLMRLNSLKRLNVSTNHIQTLYSFPVSLTNLNLSCNHITDLSALSSLKNLQYLDISCNLLKSITPLSSLVSLKSLFLGFNLLESIDTLSCIENLIEIDLEHNKFQSIESLLPLIKSQVLVFVIKNNPATADFMRTLEGLQITFKNEIFCKNPATAIIYSKIWKVNSIQCSSETQRGSKLYSEYSKSILSGDVIQEEDEIRDELLNEVEDLRKIVDEGKRKYREFFKKKIKKMYCNQEVENKLMLANEIASGRNRRILKDSGYFLKCKELKAKNKEVGEKYKNVKLQLIETIRLEEERDAKRNAAAEEISFFRAENEGIRRQIFHMEEKVIQQPRKKCKSVCKKLNSSKQLFHPSSQVKTEDRERFGCSPLYNYSFQFFTQDTKRKQSFDVLKNATYNTKGPVRLIKLNK